jgi:DNA-binding CsgD family transcriptional regulator
MAVTLSSPDLAKLTRAIHLLVSPLDHPHVDQWRSAVNHQLKELLSADSAGFLLPVSEGPMVYSEEHDPDALAAYPDVPPPDLADGTPIWAHAVRSGADTVANMYGCHYDRYLRSAYYNEYAGANGAHDPLLAATSLGGMDARSAAIMHFWHARPDGRLFGDREITLLRLLFPAFRAGVETQVRWGAERTSLLNTLDALGHCALIADRSGRVLHLSSALEALLDAEPDAALLHAVILSVARALSMSTPGAAFPYGQAQSGLVRDVRTRTARYRVTGCVYAGPSAVGSPAVVVGLERLSPVLRSLDELRDAFGLTRAEARVAVLLGTGRSNDEIAKELLISPHTARRHTERVLHKMDVRSRAEVGSKLYI